MRAILIMLFVFGTTFTTLACDEMHVSFRGYAHAMTNNVVYTYQRTDSGYKACEIHLEKDKILKPIPKGITIDVQFDKLHIPTDTGSKIIYEKCTSK